MSSSIVDWTYALANDVLVEPGVGGAYLRTSARHDWVTTGDDAQVLRLLSGSGISEARIDDQLSLNKKRINTECTSAALLYRLDRLGLLVRHLNVSGRQLASCIPLRPPPGGPVTRPPTGPMKLSPLAIVRIDRKQVCLETPGSWARVTINDRNLLGLLHDLSIEQTSTAIANAAVGYSDAVILELLALMNWCELLDLGGGDEQWSSHELYFHAHTRAGYSRVPPGKSELAQDKAVETGMNTRFNREGRVVLEPIDHARFAHSDPTFAQVLRRRQSIRKQGDVALDSTQLSEFLFRTFSENEGRRPYPSGGACYPLNTYIAVRDCSGITPGCYFYEPTLHELLAVAKPGPKLELLLADAASATDVATPPQILIVLAAQVASTHAVYPTLGYSLILKEVGAVFQAAMMTAAVMNVGTCPLGCGNSLVFSDLVGIDPLIETSVGEMMLGSLP